ncbi:ATP-dependent zinc metalloprotease FtsH [Candidatus Brocadiaceae bacterium S225]|uniref:Cell division protein ATPase n=1 Tax=Candidatus Scalindua brodae TaxID=237368 RepID=A0A0B0ENM7_9BACT|nr:MAG: cell division protein ATPase [Candidatus Scalindua brodae]TWU33953.1 ATP-dependent zinc metalloprotease FtsH [Candidatus Brocadiaceae bacterium S225]
MATANHIKSLLQSHVTGDNEKFITIAMQVAAHEARQGHSKLANELKQLIDQAKSQKNRNSNLLLLVPSKKELDGILEVSQPKINLADLTFSEKQIDTFKRIIKEYKQQNKLRNHNLEPRRKLLLIGPPGTGKTATASALANELKLPLFTIRLDGLITKFMGETATKLRHVFDAIRTTRGLYFFDEFDAIGSDRMSPNDVGEIRRVLNSFLQFLEQDDSDSVIVAATNYKKLLDPALFRRFDDVLNYDLPTQCQVKALVENKLAHFHLSMPDKAWKKIEEVSNGLSHAEITRACEDAAKWMVLEGKDSVSSQNIVDMLEDRKKAKSNV